MRAALVLDGVVDNVIEYDPDSEYELPEGQVLIELEDEPVGPGYIHKDNTFMPPPTKSLTVSQKEIPADDSTASVATYRNTHSDAPNQVEFEANGAKVSVPVSDGAASIEVTATQPGPVTISCDGLTETITAVGV